MAKTQAYYYVGSMDGVYTKVYDGKKLQAGVITYSGYKDGDTKVPGITKDSITHVSSQDLLMEDGYPQVYRDGVNMTDEYNQTQVKDPTFADLTPGYNTFTITARDITLQSATITKEYDGTALTAYSKPGGTDITDLTAGVTNKGYVTSAISGKDYDEQFNYAYTGTQLFVGSSDNSFDVSNSSTALTTDYNVTKQYGQLIVTKRTAPLTITVKDQERLYDGTAGIKAAKENETYTVTGDLATGDTITVTLTNKDGSVNAGTYADGITATYKIMHGDTDVTNMYANVTVNAGDLIINKRSVTITSDSDSKPYDGTPLTNGNTSVTAGDDFVSGEGYTATVTGSQTVPGTSKNTFSYTLDSNTKADNYNITTVEGDLTVTGVDLTITVGVDLETGLTYLYDGTATKTLSEGQYQVKGLAASDKLANVTITTASDNAGVYNDYTLSYDIVNAEGVSVKGNYNITEVKNDVEITKRTITVEAGSASKVYDGTALTCDDFSVAEGATEENKLLTGEKVDGVKMTADSTITHVSSTANKIDPSGVTITKADGSDSSMNYNVLCEDGTLTVTQRTVLLISTSADKFYDGTALQNRQVIVTGLSYLEGQPVGADEGFLKGDGCTYDFVGDDRVVDSEGTIIAWTVSEQSGTAYGQTDVGTSKNEFNYHNFTSVYYGSYESDYQIIYGNATPDWFVDKYGQKVADGLFGDLTVWGGPVEINMTDYSWTYDYQAKTNGYFDDGYSVKFTTTEDGTGSDTTSFAHNSLGEAVALFGNDSIVVTVVGQGGDAATGKVQHVSDGEKQNTATYKIYRDGNDVTEEVADYYQISIDGGVLKITPREVELVSGDAQKEYDGTALTDNTVTEGSEGLLKGFVFGEGAVYAVTGSRTNTGVSANTFEISKLLRDTQATDYKFTYTTGELRVTNENAKAQSEYNGTGVSDIVLFNANQVSVLRDTKDGWIQTGAINDVTGWDVVEARRDLTGDKLADIQIQSDAGDGTTWVATLRNDTEEGELSLNYQFIGAYDNELWSYLGSADVNADGKAEVLMVQTDAGADGDYRHVAAWVTDAEGKWVDNTWVGSLTSDWNVAGTADVTGDGQDNVILRRADGMIGYWSDAGTNDVVELWNPGESVMLTSADFDGDGTDDLLFTNADGDFFTWSKIGEGLVADKIGNEGDLVGDWNFAGAGDYNGDGLDEILWCDGTNIAYGAGDKKGFANLTTIA